VLANPNIKVLFDTVAVEIKGSKKVESVVLKDLATGEARGEAFDAVFVFVGSDPNTALAPCAAKDESSSIVTDEKMASSVPGLFAAGDVRVSPFRQIVTACADGAVAAHAASQYIDELRGAAYR
jgi:thioredoxin reductase (NADPH)